MSMHGTGATPGPDATSGTPAPAGTPSTPPAGATPPAAPPAAPAAAAPATGDAAGLGEAGQRALQAERQAAADARREAAEARAALEQLQLAGASEHDQAIAKARKDAAAEVRQELQGTIRTMQVRTELVAAGMPSARAATYAGSPAFQSLKVAEDGTVTGLPEAIAKLKADDAGLFGTTAPAAPAPGDAWDGASGGGAPGKAPGTLEESVAAAYNRQGRS